MTSKARAAWVEQNPAACYAPFYSIYLRPRAGKSDIEYTCCCNLDTTNIDSDNQEKFFDQLKQNVRDGIKPPECWRCYEDESKGSMSERIRLILGLSDEYFDKFSQQYSSSEKEVNIKFSSLCTLACRSCSSNDSTTYARITGDSSDINDLSDDPGRWQSIQQEIRRASTSEEPVFLHVIGGETLVQKGFQKLLTWMEEENLSGKFILRLTTSLAVNLKEEMFHAMSNYRNVNFNLSIDGVGENYHYVRWPAKFSKVISNLDTLIDKAKSFGYPPDIYLCPVFSLNNCFYIVEYLDFFYQWMTDKNVELPVWNINLQYPEHLSLKALPIGYRKHLQKVLSLAHEHPLLRTPKQSIFKFWIEKELEFLESDREFDYFDNFLKFTAEFDRRTNTDFRYHNSKLWDILTDQHKAIYLDHLEKANPDLNINKSMNWKIYAARTQI